MKIQKSIYTCLLYLTKIGSFLTLLNPIVTKATVVRPPTKSLKSLITLFNNGVASNTLTKSHLGNFPKANIQSSINKLTLSDFNSNITTTIKSSLRSSLVNSSSKSSSSLNINRTTSTSSPKEIPPNINVGSIVSRFEGAIKNSNQTTSLKKNKTQL